MEAPFGGSTQTLNAVLRHGVLEVAAFATYINKVLVPEIECRAVVVVDNLAAHQN